jgi:hypothetical protein
MLITDYLYYEGTLTIGVHTPRLDPAPATIYLAGPIHSEYLARVRSILREYRTTENLASGLQSYLPQQGGFPLYGIRNITPAGALRSVDDDFNLEVTLQRFSFGLAMLPTTFTADPEKYFSIERVMEKAVQDLFAANSLPHTVTTIPGDKKQLGETFIDISFELGAATEQGPLEV